MTEKKSNFTFLKGDSKVGFLYKPACAVEELYGDEKYDFELFQIRKITEQIAQKVAAYANLNLPVNATFDDTLRAIKVRQVMRSDILQLFYDVKQTGNKSAHNFIEFKQQTGLINLQKLYAIMVWFMRTYTKQKPKLHAFVEPAPRPTYNSYERKLIYIQTIDGDLNEWPAYAHSEKIGDATLNELEADARPNSDDLRAAAEKRVNSYMGTAGVPHKIQWAELAYRKTDQTFFRDHDVHEVLERSGIKKNPKLKGQEWYLVDLETAKAAIKAVKEGRKSLDIAPKKEEQNEKIKITLRPEQEKAVQDTKKAFKKHDTMLWNAKMRFGKTLTALELIKEEGFKKVLIMTHRPVVSDSWFDDFEKMGMYEEGYVFGAKSKGEDIAYLKNSTKPFIYFASIQDLRGSAIFGGKAGDKNHEFVEINWDLIIIDEAHEGTQTPLAQSMITGIKKKDTKLLELSGTPFNLLDQYEDDQVYTWDYVMEQEAKYSWEEHNPDKKNPYESLPKVSMYTFDIAEQFRKNNYQDLLDKSFNFKEFFKVGEDHKFVHEADVMQFLNNITTPDENNNYPFSTKEFRTNLRHTLWILPGVKEATALEELMKRHPVFGMDYKIVNVVKDDKSDNVEESNDSDLQKVRDAIGPNPSETKTITLTVRKLTTGVNVPEWTGVVFLSNTNSAMQYLQAAFRAQTPFTDEKLGRKEECFIFDFAPDRALTVMAESSRLNTGVGKRTSSVQKEQMAKLLNFMPIVGKAGNQMKRYEVDSLLKKIKRVYAEKAVRTGFDDDSLYSDELLRLDEADLNEFNDLKAIVGTTKKEKSPLKVDVNHQGLTDEEYEKSEKGRKKNPKDRSEEEKAAIAKANELKEQRKTMISILRSISIRIPMMIYGMDIDIQSDVDMKKFVAKVDDVSWKEFMPSGVTKELFMQFSKYYDPDVFIEAGRIIRQRVKRLDDLDPLERAEELAVIFSTFRNPDKETVLTPFRVVNMQLGKTLGGYSFYDDDYKEMTTDGRSAAHWIKTEYTDKVFTRDTHILEINSKTGLYPLYAATTLYFKRFEELNARNAGKFTPEDELMLWQDILRENIFVIAKTPMAKTITHRTLAGYQDFDTNIEYVENIVEDSKTSVAKEVKKIREVFNGMKFDVVIGNPPYQESKEGTSDSPIYNLFMDMSYELADLSVLITPARFLFNAGKTPKKWNEKMLADEHLKVVMYEPVSDNIFPRTDIKGGLAITVHDNNKNFGAIGTFTAFEELQNILKKVLSMPEFDSFSKLIYSPESYKLTDTLYKEHPELIGKMSKDHEKDVTTNVFEKLAPIFSDEPVTNNDIGIWGRLNNERVIKYTKRSYINSHENLEKYKILVPKANGSGALGETLSTPLIGTPLIGHTQTFISVGAFDTEFEAEAVLKYIKTKFLRTLIGTLKVTQDNKKGVWKNVPMQDFTQKSDIDWSKSIPEIDRQLYKKYGLSDDEINFIETKVQEMK
ncbi:Superfamily II DNA or RNA helicase [Ligilactobacillus sp. WC1T17]|uniref:Superfamily II DNA or RNA helicase n=1 Tax=Ligilactobacillus ruminis TaxID=1623 RepID=A0ABY1AEZ0_9LACO|nr:Superfamily II DNA or RNA helicase [Ligilactobacillus ruminis]